MDVIIGQSMAFTAKVFSPNGDAIQDDSGGYIWTLYDKDNTVIETHKTDYTARQISIAIPKKGTYTLSVYSPGNDRYYASNTATAIITVNDAMIATVKTKAQSKMPVWFHDSSETQIQISLPSR
jgi:hypothetical protein